MAELDSLYSFPPGPAGAEEWPGTPLAGGGAHNRITRLKGRTPTHDKTLDARPAERDALLTWAEGHARLLGDAVQQMDVVVHGVRVRALTNSPHLADFFRVNWFSPAEWAERTGAAAPAEPQLLAYALNGVAGKPASAYYSRARNTVLFLNTSYYGQLKSWVLGAVGRLLAEERGIHSIHGACVELGRDGILYVAPTGTGKSTSSYGLMHLPGSRFHSDDWVYVRYTLPGPGGEPVAPTTLHLDGREVYGAAAIATLLDTAGSPPRGRFAGYRLNGEPIEGDLATLDTAAPLSAYAYTSEKVFYLRTNLVESFPLAAPAMLAAPTENVPDVLPAFLEKEAAMLRAAAEQSPGGNGKATPDMLRDLARMVAFDNARAMLDAEAVFGRERVVADPMQPTRLSAVFLLERAFDQERVLAPLSEDRFLTALLVGLTPTGTNETAYNAYRAVDDAAERRAVSALMASGATDNVYARLRASADAPATLVAEATLFRALHRAARTFLLNTILQRDPAVQTRAEAVARTLRLIVAATRGQAAGELDLASYSAALDAAAADEAAKGETANPSSVSATVNKRSNPSA